MTQEHKVSKCCRKNVVYIFAEHRVATNLIYKNQYLQSERNKVKHNKMKYGCSYLHVSGHMASHINFS